MVDNNESNTNHESQPMTREARHRLMVILIFIGVGLSRAYPVKADTHYM